MINELHGAPIEIMSPTVMAQRPLTTGSVLVPPLHHGAEPEVTNNAEQIMFDKADIATRISKFESDKARLLEEIAELVKDADANKHRIRWRKRQIDSLDEMLVVLGAGHAAD